MYRGEREGVKGGGGGSRREKWKERYRGEEKEIDV